MGKVTTRDERITAAVEAVRKAVLTVKKELLAGGSRAEEIEAYAADGKVIGTLVTSEPGYHRELGYAANKRDLTVLATGGKDGHYDWAAGVYIKPYIWIEVSVI